MSSGSSESAFSSVCRRPARPRRRPRFVVVVAALVVSKVFVSVASVAARFAVIGRGREEERVPALPERGSGRGGGGARPDPRRGGCPLRELGRLGGGGARPASRGQRRGPGRPRTVFSSAFAAAACVSLASTTLSEYGAPAAAPLVAKGLVPATVGEIIKSNTASKASPVAV